MGPAHGQNGSKVTDNSISPKRPQIGPHTTCTPLEIEPRCTPQMTTNRPKRSKTATNQSFPRFGDPQKYHLATRVSLWSILDVFRPRGRPILSYLGVKGYTNRFPAILIPFWRDFGNQILSHLDPIGPMLVTFPP